MKHTLIIALLSIFSIAATAQTTTSFTPTTVGWYRIASTFARQGGTIQIVSEYDNRVTDIEFQYNMGSYGVGGSIQQTRYSSYNQGTVSQARISTTGAANYLDIYISSATTPGVVTIKGDGYFMPALVASPVVGAVAGSTEVFTLAFKHGFNTTNGITGARLQLDEDSANDPLMIYRYNNNPALAGGVTVSRARGTLTAPAPVLASDRLLSLLGRSYNGSGSYNPYTAGIVFYAAEDQTSTNGGSYITFETASLGTTGRFERMRVSPNGNIGIGTSNPTEKLSVNGTIRTKEVKVESANWPDFVFKPNYPLKSLASVKAYVDKYEHLPEVPTAAEIEKNGQNVGEMNKLLLKKVEELTLYLIQKDKQMAALEKKQRVEISRLSKRISALSKSLKK